MQIRKKIPKSDFKLPDCKHIIIDTDAGGDDTQAIIYAISEAKKTNKKIIGITCIDGNATIDNVSRNVLIALTIAEANIPIYKGKFVVMKAVLAIWSDLSSKIVSLVLMDLD